MLGKCTGIAIRWNAGGKDQCMVGVKYIYVVATATAAAAGQRVVATVCVCFSPSQTAK